MNSIQQSLAPTSVSTAHSASASARPDANESAADTGDAAQIEREFVDAYLSQAESRGATQLRPQVESLAASGLSASGAAFLAVGGAVGFALALSLAGESFAASQPQLVDSVDRPYLEARREVGRVGEEQTGLYVHPEVPAAFTSGSSVYLNPQLEPHLGSALVDWIVGHELGHVKEHDGLEAIGRSFVLGQLQASGVSQETLAPLQALHEELNRECEFEADRHGFDYAVSRGHDGDGLLAAAGAFLESVEGSSIEQAATHPPAAERLARLRQHRLR